MFYSHNNCVTGSVNLYIQELYVSVKLLGECDVSYVKTSCLEYHWFHAEYSVVKIVGANSVIAFNINICLGNT
jgi:hypothetical protein